MRKRSVIVATLALAAASTTVPAFVFHRFIVGEEFAAATEAAVGASIGAFPVLLPFFLLGVLAILMARAFGGRVGWLQFGLTAPVLFAIYVVFYRESALDYARQAWTGSVMDVADAAIVGTPLVLLAGLIGFLAAEVVTIARNRAARR